MLRIPEELLEQAHLKDGAPVSLRVSAEGGIVIQTEERDPDQWWFWTEEWQKGEREADEDKAAGRVSAPMTGEEFLADSSESTAKRATNCPLLRRTCASGPSTSAYPEQTAPCSCSPFVNSSRIFEPGASLDPRFE